MSLTQALIESHSGSDFLKRAEHVLKQSEPDFSYSAFAKQAGFSARSYVREVFQGKKPLSVKAFSPFAQAFGFNREERELMRSLFVLDNPDFAPALPLEKARALIARKRRVAELKNQRKQLAHPIGDLTLTQRKQLKHWPKIFAGLGIESRPEQLAEKLRIALPSLLQTLDAMKNAGLVQVRAGQWSVIDRHVMLDPELHREMIRGHFHEVSKKSIQKSQDSFADPEQLYYVASFGVQKSRLPELKSQLIETLTRFMESCDDGREDEIVSLAVSLIRPS